MPPLRLLIVAASVLIFPAALALPADSAKPASVGVNIVHVNPLQLSHYLKDYDTVVIFYYVEYCSVCVRLQEVYARASYQLERQQQQLLLAGGDVKKRIFAAVNCGTNYHGCIGTGVSRVPAFKLVRNGGRDVQALPFRFVTVRKLLEAINVD